MPAVMLSSRCSSPCRMKAGVTTCRQLSACAVSAMSLDRLAAMVPGAQPMPAQLRRLQITRYKATAQPTCCWHLSVEAALRRPAQHLVSVSCRPSRTSCTGMLSLAKIEI